jgi:hypothetical protein
MIFMPKLLIASGIALILIGLAWQFGGKFLHFGRLPGDIFIEKQNFRFYFPITTSILLSIFVSLVAYLIRKFGSK